MDLQGIKVLIDGINLELPQGTGIATYGTSLIKALKKLGADPSVLISKYSLKEDKHINTAALSLFQAPVKPWVRYNYLLIAKALFGLSEKASSIPLPKDMIVTQGMKGFSYIYDVGFYGSRNCYEIADSMKYCGRRVTIKTRPRMDIWHATYFTPIAVKGAAKITTIHDLIPLRLPHTTLNDKGIFIQQVRDALKHSDLIICVSENTKKDILQFFDIHPEKLFVTYQPVVISREPPEKEAVLRKLKYYNLEYNNYILFVGAIEPKKNLRRLIEACLSLESDLPLAIVGKKAWLWEDELKMLYIKEQTDRDRNRILKRIHLLEYVPGADLPALYRGARCLAFPSLYEGFGLPPVEAMSLGCPVVTSLTSSLPEICGDAALYVDPYDPADIADKLTMLINNDGLKAGLIKAGYERAAYFSMENYMQRLQEAYKKVL